MAPDVLNERILLAGAVALLMVGAATAWTSANVTKRIAAIVLAQLGALSALSALGAASSLLLAGVAAMFAQLALGVALITRLQEAYASIEAPEIDAADAQSETEAPKT